MHFYIYIITRHSASSKILIYFNLPIIKYIFTFIIFNILYINFFLKDIFVVFDPYLKKCLSFIILLFSPLFLTHMQV